MPRPRGRSRPWLAGGSSSAARTARSTRSTPRPAASSGPSARRAASGPRRSSGLAAMTRATPCTSATPAPMSTPSTPARAPCAGRARVHDHPFARVTGTPTLDGERLYVPVSSLEETAANQPGYECCTFRGSVVASSAGDRRGDLAHLLVPPAAGRSARTPRACRCGRPRASASGRRRRSTPSARSSTSTTGNTYSGTAAEPTTDALIALDPKTGASASGRSSSPSTTCSAAAPARRTASRRPDPTSTSARRRHWSPRADGRDVILLGQKSGMAYAVDPDQRGRAALAVPRRAGIDLGRHPVGRRRRRRHARSCPVSDIRTPTPGGLHAVSLATRRARVVPAAAAAQVRGRPRPAMPR